MTFATPDYRTKRRKLVNETQRVDKICKKLRDTKVKELSPKDPEATIFSLYKELASAKETRLDYPINFLEGFWQTMILCGVLRVALGGDGVEDVMEEAHTTAEWLHGLVTSLPPGELEFSGQTEDLLKATLMTSDDWRAFAAETQASAKQGMLKVAEPHLFRRWLTLAGIKPRW